MTLTHDPVPGCALEQTSEHPVALEPAVGAVFMSLSTIVVATNAQLLKFRLVAR